MASIVSLLPYSRLIYRKTCASLCNICKQSCRSNTNFIRFHQPKARPKHSIHSLCLERHFTTFPINSLWTHNSSSVSTKLRFNIPFLSMEDPMPKEAKEQPAVEELHGWINVGPYSVFAWSVSGTESCIIVKSDDVLVAFDMGVAIPESLKAANVFITHGHIDHIGAVCSHVAKRSLNGQKPARYFVAPHLVDSLLTVTKAYYTMAQTVESLENVRVLPIAEGDCIRLNSRFFVKTFPTIHRIPSQGYILYKEEKRLKEEYRGIEGFEIAALHRKGTDIHDIIITPEIAYTGDTVFDVFTNPPTPDLLKVKLLISEATFLDDDKGRSVVQKARDRGHIHLSEYAQNADLFAEVGHIILVHFSNKYPCKYILDTLRDKLPPALGQKVTPATVAKATTAATYKESLR